MRPIIQLMRPMSPPLPQHHRVRQRRRPRSNMHRRAPGKIQSPHLIRPPRGIPRPARNGIVNHRRPDEHEYHAGQHPPPLGDGAGGQRDGNGREHALVDGEEQIGDSVGSDGGVRKHVDEAEVRQVTNVRAGGPRKGQGVAPEEPLEGCDGCGHYGEPDQGQGGFAAGEARVEEAVAGC